MALTKNDIVEKVYGLGFTKKEAVEIIESLLEIMKSTLEKGRMFWFQDLGNSA